MLIISLISCNVKNNNLGGFEVDYDHNNFKCLVINKTDRITYINSIPCNTIEVTYAKGDIVKKEIIGYGGNIIEAIIDDCKSNDNFIIIKQLPIYDICDFDKITINQCEEKLNNYKKYCYWIIQKNINTIYGPYSKDIFENEINTKNIGLKFDN
ncbi:MAG: hypothetical protein QM535_13940 [Limnohabitans sp.]|nr:hypothetical protein [Limnohabitans sp.]